MPPGAGRVTLLAPAFPSDSVELKPPKDTRLSMRIGVLSFQEKAGRDRPTVHVSKSTAIKWLTLGTHRPVDKRTIQQLDPATVGKRPYAHPAQIYIPETLPNPELPGIKTVGLKRSEFGAIIWGQRVFPLKWNRQYA